MNVADPTKSHLLWHKEKHDFKVMVMGSGAGKPLVDIKAENCSNGKDIRLQIETAMNNAEIPKGEYVAFVCNWGDPHTMTAENIIWTGITMTSERRLHDGTTQRNAIVFTLDRPKPKLKDIDFMKLNKPELIEYATEVLPAEIVEDIPEWNDLTKAQIQGMIREEVNRNA